MNILYIGDIMGESGMQAVAQALPRIRKQYPLDAVIAQAENVTDGKSMSLSDMKKLQVCGIDFFTGGNHTPAKQELHSLLSDPLAPVIGPANMNICPGPGWKFLETKAGKVLVISILGSTVGRDQDIANPLKTIDEILELNTQEQRAATIVNFHGDYSSEKVIMGYYLDGRVTAVVGDHWHVPTADAMVLPKGTAHITDVGMCGALHSSLGVTFDSVIPRWKENKQTVNVLSKDKPYQFNAVLIETDSAGLARSIKQIQEIIT